MPTLSTHAELVLGSSPSSPPSPPSPLDSSPSPRRLSWGKLVQRLADFSGSMESSSDLSDSASDTSGDLSPSDDLFFDPMEEHLLKEVVERIACSLRDAKDSECALRCSRLLIPDKLLQHIGRELVHQAATEPCGLRGALIDLCVEGQGQSCESVSQLSVDPYLVPTFQLALVLRLETSGIWPKIQGLFSPSSPLAGVIRQEVKLSTGFRVIKKKLYCSEELLIEEC